MNLVSIIIPYYKKKLYIEETLNSAINQTYKETEIIIIFGDPGNDDLSFFKALISRSITSFAMDLIFFFITSNETKYHL